MRQVAVGWLLHNVRFPTNVTGKCENALIEPGLEPVTVPNLEEQSTEWPTHYLATAKCITLFLNSLFYNDNVLQLWCYLIPAKRQSLNNMVYISLIQTILCGMLLTNFSYI